MQFYLYNFGRVKIEQTAYDHRILYVSKLISSFQSRGVGVEEDNIVQVRWDMGSIISAGICN